MHDDEDETEDVKYEVQLEVLLNSELSKEDLITKTYEFWTKLDPNCVFKATVKGGEDN